MRPRSISLFPIVGTLVLASPSHASVFYWDGTDTTANADGGSGIWDTALTNWDTLATAGADIAWPSITTLDDDAVFGGTAGTVSIAAGGITANSLTFNTANYILQGGKITLNGTTPTITNSVAATINSELAGTAGFTKTGTGTLTLGAANTQTGTTNISGGSLVAAHVNALTTSNTVNISTSTGAGTLRLATDTSVGAYKIGASSSNQGTIISDRATAGAGITHVLGTGNLGSNTYNFQAGGNVTSGTAGISFSSMTLSSGAGGTTTLNPTTAALTIVGGASSSNTSAKDLALGGTHSGNSIGGVIANGSATAFTLTKSNTSTWTLGGANTYTGATSISAGTLRITHSSALGSTAAGTTVASGATLALSGGLSLGAETLSLTGTGVSSAGAVRSISGINSMSGAVTLAGATWIGVEANSLEMSGTIGGTQDLTAVGAGKLILSGGGTFARMIVGNSAVAAGGNLEWKNGTGTTAGNYFGIGDNVSASFTMSGGSLTVSPTSSLFVGSFSSSAVTGTMNVTGGTFTVGNASAVHVGGGGYNGNVSGTGVLNISNGTFSTGTTTGTFRMGANAAAQTGSGEINLSGTGILETARSLTKGAQGAATVNFDGGTYKLRATQATMFGTGVITNVKAGGAVVDTNGFDGTIGTVLAAATPSGGLTKLGTGVLTLNGTNTYTGGTTITAGMLALGDAGALSTSGTITMNGGTLRFSASNTNDYSSRMLLADGKTATIDTNGQNLTFASAFQIGTLKTGALNKAGTGTLTLSAANTFSGGTTIGTGSGTAGGVLAVSNAQALGTGGITINGSNSTVSTLQLSNNIAITNAGAMSLTYSRSTATSAHIQNLSGNNSLNSNITLSTIATGGSGANILSTAGTLTLTGNLSNSNSTTRAFIFYGDGDTTVTGAIQTGSGGGTAVTMAGAGKLTLSGNNTYTGTTTITGGTLALTGTGSISDSSAIIVGANTTFDVSGVTGGFNLANGQTISGPGTVTGAMTVSGTLSPGSSPGTLTTGSQTWVDGGDYNWQILDANGAAGTGHDTIALTGTLDLSSLTTGGFNINLWSLSSIGPDVSGNALNFIGTNNYSWTLASASSGITGFNATDFVINLSAVNGTAGFSNSLSGGNFSISQSGNNLVLNFTAVPEPGAALLGGLGLLALLRRRR